MPDLTGPAGHSPFASNTSVVPGRPAARGGRTWASVSPSFDDGPGGGVATVAAVFPSGWVSSEDDELTGIATTAMTSRQK